jgi:hypothetical protein
MSLPLPSLLSLLSPLSLLSEVIMDKVEKKIF